VSFYWAPTERIHLLTGYAIENQTDENRGRAPTSSYNRTPHRAYSQVDYQVHDKVKLLAGFQWNRPEGGGSDYISRLGIIANFTERWGIKLLCGQAFRAPWPNETDIDVSSIKGNPDLKPEEITTYDAQLFFHDQQNRYAFTYFHSRLKKLIGRDLAPTPDTFVNGGSQQFWGLELEANHHFGSGLYLLGSFTYQDNKESSMVNPSVISAFMAKAGLGYRGKQWSGSLFNTFFSNPVSIKGALDVNPDPDPQNLITADLKVNISRWLPLKQARTTLEMRGENLLNQKVYFPEYGRRRINSLPGQGGIAGFAGITVQFH
jgi:outer membrane receptor protein involved in Fe transport